MNTTGKIIIAAVLGLSFFVNIATAQENVEWQVPANVIEAFNALYPEMKEVAWQYREPDFEASFKINKKAVSLLFDEYGYVNEVKNEIMNFELPNHVNNILTKEYSGWKVDRTSHIDVNGTGYYEAVVEKEKKIIILVFNSYGGLLAKVIL